MSLYTMKWSVNPFRMPKGMIYAKDMKEGIWYEFEVPTHRVRKIQSRYEQENIFGDQWESQPSEYALLREEGTHERITAAGN